MKYKIEGLNKATKDLHQFQLDAGFDDSNIIQRLMLVHSEISEAFEAYRKDKYANKLDMYHLDLDYFDGTLEAWKEKFEEGIKDTMEDEIADAIIRLLAFCGENDIDIEKHIALKMAYNEMRGHKYGGKKF